MVDQFVYWEEFIIKTLFFIMFLYDFYEFMKWKISQKHKSKKE